NGFAGTRQAAGGHSNPITQQAPPLARKAWRERGFRRYQEAYSDLCTLVARSLHCRVTTAASRESQVESSQANINVNEAAVPRYADLVGFQKITAPSLVTCTDWRR